MSIGECLQEILRATAGISEPEACEDSMRAELRDQLCQLTVNEYVRCGYARGSGRPQLIAMTTQA
jgi:hypothetical protein